MHILYSFTCAVLLIFGCAVNTLGATDSYVFGLETDDGRTFENDALKFVGLNVSTGNFEILNNAAPPFSQFDHIQNTAIDTRNQRYTYISSNGIVTSLDMYTGNIIVGGITIPGKLQGLQYDPVSHRYYAIQLLGPYRFISMDPETFEISIIIEHDINSDLSSVGVSAGIDVDRRTYIIQNALGKFVSLDLNTGEQVSVVRYSEQLYFAEYNSADGLIYGLHRILGRYIKLVSVDPLSGTEVVLKDYTNQPLTALALKHSVGIHAESNIYYIGTAEGLLAIDLSSLEAQNVPGLERRTFDGLCVLPGDRKVQLLNGQFFADFGGNCVLDDDDSELSKQTLLINPIGKRIYSRADGSFKTPLPYGEYEVVPTPIYPWAFECEFDPQTIIVNEEGITVSNLEVPLYPEVLLHRLDLSIAGSVLTVGRTTRYYIEVHNSGTVAYTGTVQFRHDERMLFESSQPEFSAYDGQLGEFEIVQMPIGASETFTVDMRVPPEEELRGVTICARVDLKEKRTDLLAQYEDDEFCGLIRGPYDPNDIAVEPAGLGERGFINRDVATLTYTIRFQNIGSAPAQDVVILDTLDEDLDISKLHFGAGSHPYSASLLKNNILEFRFENINLPGKMVDELGSQGVIKYDIDLNKSLALDTEISNSAAIYFDFNKPVITNTVLNTIGEAITDVAAVDRYDDELELRSLDKGHFVLQGSTGRESLSGRLSVHSILGTTVYAQALENVSSVAIDLSSLVSGRYLLRLEAPGETFVTSLVIMP